MCNISVTRNLAYSFYADESEECDDDTESLSRGGNDNFHHECQLTTTSHNELNLNQTCIELEKHFFV